MFPMVRRFDHNRLTWHRESYSRNSLETQVFPNLVGDRDPNFGDVLIVADIGEIPRPETFEYLHNCDFSARSGIHSQLFIYLFQWHRTDWDWFYSSVTHWQGKNTILLEWLKLKGHVLNSKCSMALHFLLWNYQRVCEQD